MNRADEPMREQLYRWWWTHDAAWYQAVKRKFGAEVANELNREAMRQVAQRVAEYVRKRLPRPIEDMPWAEVVDAFETCPKLMWPPGMVEFDYAPTGPGEFEVNLRQNFSLAMLRRADSLETYECACLEMRAGWFAGLGLDPADDRIEQCLAKGGTACTFRASVRGYDETSEARTSESPV
jgi:hypothetical protein